MVYKEVCGTRASNKMAVPPVLPPSPAVFLVQEGRRNSCKKTFVNFSNARSMTAMVARCSWESIWPARGRCLVRQGTMDSPRAGACCVPRPVLAGECERMRKSLTCSSPLCSLIAVAVVSLETGDAGPASGRRRANVCDVAPLPSRFWTHSCYPA